MEQVEAVGQAVEAVPWLDGFTATARCLAAPEPYVGVLVDGQEIASTLDSGHRQSFWFQSVAGETYILRTAVSPEEDPHVDTILLLVSVDGSEVVARSDDDGDDDASLIVWTATETRAREVIVRGWGETSGDIWLAVETTPEVECSWSR